MKYMFLAIIILMVGAQCLPGSVIAVPVYAVVTDDLKPVPDPVLAPVPAVVITETREVRLQRPVVATVRATRAVVRCGVRVALVPVRAVARVLPPCR